MDISRKDNNNFKYIFDKLDESIIIIQDKSFQIDYVNNKFLMEFDHEILSIYNNNSQLLNQNQQNRESTITKSIKYIK